MDSDNFSAPMSLPATLPDQNPNYSLDLTTFDYILINLATALNIYYSPMLIVLGSLGNLISVFVFFTSKLRMQSTSLYLSALAISDMVFLLQLVPPWLNTIRFTNLFYRAGFCQVFVYISYVSCFLSAWLVVAFTIERFVAVLYPLRRTSMCTVTRAKHIIILLVFAALALNSPVIKFASHSTNDCNIDIDYMEHAARFNIVDTVLAFTIPLAIIIVLNTWIMVGVYRLERARQSLVKAEQASDPAHEPPGQSARARPIHQSLLPRSQNRITRMLLIVSTVYVVLNLPAYTMRLLAYAYDMSTDEYSGRWAALQQLALLFFNTNFGINFILYCLTGQNFRRALCQSIPCLRRYTRRSAGTRRASFHAARASSVSTSFASATEAASTHVASTSVSTAAPRNMRLHRSEPVIKRWTFNNRRVQRTRVPPAEPPIEMQVIGPVVPMLDRNI